MIFMEIEKIWKKKSFLCILLISMALQVFVLWYTSVYNVGGVPLTEYKKLNSVLSTMTEAEKGDYISDKEDLGDEYLEFVKVNGYAAYLGNITERRENMSSISIFADSQKSDFSQKNIEKSAKDHEGMENIEPIYFASKGIKNVLKLSLSDILVILISAYFAMLLVWEEKENGICMITRATQKGRMQHIVSKLIALFIHVVSVSLAFDIVNYLWYGIFAGFVDLKVPIQSVAAFLESDLSWNLLEMCAAVWLSRALCAAILGLIVLITAEMAKTIWVPLFAALMTAIAGAGCYELIDVHSKFAGIKFLSLWGLLRGDNLFGEYVNVNLFGTPVNGRWLCAFVNVMLMIILVTMSILVFLFLYNGSIVDKKGRKNKVSRFGKTLFSQELYKILFMNKAIVVIILFIVFSGYMQYSRQYPMPAKEVYYQNIMLELEGQLDEQREKVIRDEQIRFDEAFEQIEKIERLEAEGKLSAIDADSKKSKYEMITSFYPQFEKVLYHYEQAKADGTQFLYDTGYLQLFWRRGGLDDLLRELILAAVAIIFGFASIMTMEEEHQTWMLIGTTYTGKNKIVKKKWCICGIIAAIMGVCNYVFRLIMIDSRYPVRKIFYSANTIMGYDGLNIPLAVFMFLELVVHILLYVSIAAAVLAVSSRRKKTVEAYLLSAIIIVIPLVLVLLMLH